MWAEVSEYLLLKIAGRKSPQRRPEIWVEVHLPGDGGAEGSNAF